MDNVLYGHNTKTQDVDTLFGSDKINKGVSLLGKGVGVAVVSIETVNIPNKTF